MQVFVVVVCGLLCLQACVQGARPRLAEFTTSCRADDPEIGECVRRTMLKVIPKLAKGVRELGLIPFDPMQVPEVVIDQRGQSAVGLKLTFIDSMHEGVSQLHPNTVRVIPERMFFEVNSTLSYYRITGQYDVSGRILLLPVTGHGPSNLTMNDLEINWKFFGKPETRNNKMYCKLSQSSFKMTIKSGSIKLEKLFNGDKLLGDNMNRILNENFSDVISELLPALEPTFAELYLRLITPFFNSIPYQDVYPGIDLSKVREGSLNL